MAVDQPPSSRSGFYGKRRRKSASRRKLLRLAKHSALQLIDDQQPRLQSPKPVVRGLAVGCVCVGVSAPLLRHRLRIAQPLISILAWQAPIALAFAFKQSRMRDASIYALQMLAYVAHYEMPNDQPQALQSRLRVNYPIQIDRVLGLGEVPTLRLQRALGRRGDVGAHDVVLSCVHWTWFGMPHAALVYILLRHRRQFLRSALSMAAVFDAGLVFYWNAPTAPPWWASENGYMPPVRRLMVETGKRYWRRMWKPLYDSLAGNPFAAMPSLHFATSVMAAHLLSDVSPRAGRIGWTYAGTLGFALVYLGEHYVVDLVAGLALAEAVRACEPYIGTLAPARALIGYRPSVPS